MDKESNLSNILYIDSNDSYYKSLYQLNRNYRITIVNNYKESLSEISKKHYDLIVANQRIKKDNVFNFKKSLDINNIKISCIVISKFAKAPDVIKALKLGAKDFILKNKNFGQTLNESINKNLKNIYCELKLKEEAIDKKKYQALMEGASDGILLQSPNGDIIDCNNAACEIFGYTKEEILKKNITDFVTKKYIESLPDIISERETTLGLPRESINRKKDGSLINVLYSTRIVEIEKKNYVLVYIKNTTELKKVQESLVNSENKLRSLFTAMQDIVLEIDYKGKYIFVSKAASNLLYKEKNELIGSTIHQIFPKEQADFFLNGINRTLKENDVVSLEYPLKINNKNMWFEARLTPYSDNSVIFIGRNITKRKNQEKITEIILNISNTINYTKDLNHLFKVIHLELEKIFLVNNFFIALYNKKNKKIKFPYIIDENKVDYSGEYENILSSYLIEKGESVILTKEEIINIEKQGKIKFIGEIPEIFLSATLKDHDNNIVGLIGLFDYNNKNAYNEEDKEILEFVSNQISLTTQRKQLEINLYNSKIKAEESDRLKSAFLANMSHEIRTPMNSILGFSELLSEFDQNAEEKEKFIKIIQKNGNYLLELINNIIDISKIEAGAMIITETKFSVNKMIFDLFNSFKSNKIITKNNIELTFNNELLDEESIIFVDDLKLRQILTNLLSNAAKNTEKGFIKFGYSKILNEVDNKYYLKFFVKDSGIGISKFDQKVIFKRFMQANITKNRLQEGTGIGLALCKNITELLGGNIWVKSEINKGSTFFFTIPYKTKS